MSAPDTSIASLVAERLAHELLALELLALKMWRKELSALQIVRASAKLGISITQMDAKSMVYVTKKLRDFLNTEQKAAVSEERAVRGIVEVLKTCCVFKAKIRRNSRGHVGDGRQVCAHDRDKTVAVVSQHVPVVDQMERAVPLVRQVGLKSCAHDESDDEAPGEGHHATKGEAGSQAKSDDGGAHHSST